MNQEIKNKLTESRGKVIDAYNEMVSNDVLNQKIHSMKFFGKVVMQHFEQLSTRKQKQVLSDKIYWIGEFGNAIDKAKYSCAAPARRMLAETLNAEKRGLILE